MRKAIVYADNSGQVYFRKFQSLKGEFSKIIFSNPEFNPLIDIGVSNSGIYGAYNLCHNPRQIRLRILNLLTNEIIPNPHNFGHRLSSFEFILNCENLGIKFENERGKHYNKHFICSKKSKDIKSGIKRLDDSLDFERKRLISKERIFTFKFPIFHPYEINEELLNRYLN